MPAPRVRFTIEGLMIAVAAVAGFLGLLRMSPSVLFGLFAFLALDVPGDGLPAAARTVAHRGCPGGRDRGPLRRGPDPGAGWSGRPW